MEYAEQPLRRINSYEGIVVKVQVDQILLPDGNRSFRETVVHPGGVGVLPVDEHGTAYCVSQFRYPPREQLLEIPAGKREAGEDPLECGVRELSEETGFTAGRLIPLGAYYTSPGFSTEKLFLYLALDLQQGEAHLDAGEFLDVVKLPFTELLELVVRGQVPDGKTAIAVLQAEKLLRAEGIVR